MTDACGIRPTATRDLAGAQPDLASPCVLDLDGCDRLEITVGLFEHEKVSLRFESWPPRVRNDLASLVARWQTGNPTRILQSITTAVVERSCVMIVHHAAKG